MRAWVARNFMREARVFFDKPQIGFGTWVSRGFSFRVQDSDLPEGINIEFEDDEPIEVELKIEMI